MQTEKYFIKDAATKVNVESHVLRYWEEELELNIRRNDQGHRYYTEEDIQQFIKIKELKKQGYQLRAIRSMLTQKQEEKMPEFRIIATQSPIPTKSIQLGNEDKTARLQSLLKQMITEAVREHDEVLCTEIKESVIKEMDYQFRIQEDRLELMEKSFIEREELRDKERMEREENHYKRIDEVLRCRSKREKKRRRI